MLLIATQFLLCQQSSLSYPDYFSSAFLNHNILNNPAYVQDSSMFCIGTAYKSRIGLLNEVATSAAYAGVNLDKHQKHFFKVMLFNEKEGLYINAPKLYGNYNIVVRLNSFSTISTGASMGYHGISFTAPSGSGSLNTIDGNIGMVLKIKNVELGASTEQLFNNRKILFSNYIYMKRYFQLYLNTLSTLGPFWNFKSHWFFIPRSGYQVANVSVLMAYKNTFEFGSTYKLNQGMAYFVNFTVTLATSTLKTSLCYNTSTLSNKSRLVNNYEITLGYNLKRKKTGTEIEEPAE
jgi:Type IX secretion system membrane protein PorP/SprF